MGKIDLKTLEKDEPILAESSTQYTLFPLKYPDLWQYYVNAEASFWTANEIDLAKDLDHWNNKLNDNERYFIKHVLAFFASSDTLINLNLGERFLNEVKIQEAKCFYGFQLMMENIHSQVYSLLIETYIQDSDEKDRLFRGMETIPCIKKKADWMFKWIQDDKSCFAERLIAFAAVEGIFFSGSFAAIFWLKKRGLMPGLATSNEFISRDEGLHRDWAVALYGKLNNKLDQKTVHALIKEAVDIECEFLTDALPVRLIGINADLMKIYMKFVGDHLIAALGYEKIYNVSNPFEWMVMAGIEGYGNFFERREVNYAKFGTLGKRETNHVFDTSVDF